jgi:hypothetical protein
MAMSYQYVLISNGERARFKKYGVEKHKTWGKKNTKINSYMAPLVIINHPYASGCTTQETAVLLQDNCD